MKVFLDTNVLASAAATRGLCADVLREVFASHRPFHIRASPKRTQARFEV